MGILGPHGFRFLGGAWLTRIQRIQQEYSHGFRKKKIREIRGIRGFQSATNYHELFFHVPIVTPFLWIFG